MLRGADHASIVKLLRLFNLCDLGFYSETKQEVEVSAKRNIRARVVHNATEQSQVHSHIALAYDYCMIVEITL